MSCSITSDREIQRAPKQQLKRKTEGPGIICTQARECKQEFSEETQNQPSFSCPSDSVCLVKFWEYEGRVANLFCCYAIEAEGTRGKFAFQRLMDLSSLLLLFCCPFY